jgi:16S rRNA (guanine966-N2)-methyltransferase
VAHALRKLAARNITVDFVFLDPPYRMEEIYSQTLKLLSQSPLLKPDTIVVAEHTKRFDPGDDFGPLHRYRLLRQGDTALSFYGMKPTGQ